MAAAPAHEASVCEGAETLTEDDDWTEFTLDVRRVARTKSDEARVALRMEK